MEELSITKAIERIRQQTNLSEYLAFKWLYTMEASGAVTILPDNSNKSRKLISIDDVDKIIAAIKTRKS